MSGIRNIFSAGFKPSAFFTGFFTGVAIVGFVANMDKLVPSVDNHDWFEKLLKK